MKNKMIAALILMLASAANAFADTSADCEKIAERAALNYYVNTGRYGELKARAKTVEIRSSNTSAVIVGQRYKTAAEASVTYIGTTGGETNEVIPFVMTVEIGTDNKFSILKFEEVKSKAK